MGSIPRCPRVETPQEIGRRDLTTTLRVLEGLGAARIAADDIDAILDACAAAREKALEACTTPDRLEPFFARYVVRELSVRLFDEVRAALEENEEDSDEWQAALAHLEARALPQDPADPVSPGALSWLNPATWALPEDGPWSSHATALVLLGTTVRYLDLQEARFEEAVHGSVSLASLIDRSHDAAPERRREPLEMQALAMRLDCETLPLADRLESYPNLTLRR